MPVDLNETDQTYIPGLETFVWGRGASPAVHMSGASEDSIALSSRELMDC